MARFRSNDEDCFAPELLTRVETIAEESRSASRELGVTYAWTSVWEDEDLTVRFIPVTGGEDTCNGARETDTDTTW